MSVLRRVSESLAASERRQGRITFGAAIAGAAALILLVAFLPVRVDVDIRRPGGSRPPRVALPTTLPGDRPTATTGPSGAAGAPHTGAPAPTRPQTPGGGSSGGSSSPAATSSPPGASPGPPGTNPPAVTAPPTTNPPPGGEDESAVAANVQVGPVRVCVRALPVQVTSGPC